MGRMSRDDQIEAILEHGRRTRARPSRWLWIVSALVGGCCAVAFAWVMLADGDPAPVPGNMAGGVTDTPAVQRRPGSGGGLGIGLVIGACVGIVIGFSIGRQRADHSSRNSP